MAPSSSRSASRSSHHALVARQFGTTADAYVASPVHASGEDLAELEALVMKAPQARVLDLGCGGGHVAFRVSPWVAEVVAYDLSAEMLAAVDREAKPRQLSNITCKQGPVEQLPFADASFDWVMSRFSAHHWHDVDTALAEARRVLKPGGGLAVADTASPSRALLDTWLQTIELVRDPSHARNLSVAEWTAALTKAGFAITGTTLRRLRLDFPTWVARIGTPAVRIEALRTLHAVMPQEVAAYLELEADGSFSVDKVVITAA